MQESVSATYVHGDKTISPAPFLDTQGRRFKWYGISTSAKPVPGEVEMMARAFLARADLSQASDLGFVVLHRCGADFYFLIVCSWRGDNEIWQSVYAKELGDEGFRDWPRPGPHLPTYCVWEMGAVAYESAAWRRYLLSPRDRAARAAWLEDQYEGPI
ncbi:MAG TPA: hypothetical protein VG889_03735 [Rhizomicrobium sp.]|nr:hypothetical protein [Rhizomicrobium sp.]